MPDFLIYGANGYTGSLIARAAVAQGRQPILAGRNAELLIPVARELGLNHRIFSLDHPQAVEEGIRGVPVVLHCAGAYGWQRGPAGIWGGYWAPPSSRASSNTEFGQDRS